MDSLDAKLLKMISGLFIGARFRPDEYGKRGFDRNGDIMGDYEQSWDRKMANNIFILQHFILKNHLF